MKTWKIGKPLLLCLLLAVVAYPLSYIYIRSTSVERWDKDGRDYVIFPKKPLFVYYLYRPLALLDGQITGMRFHIGPHQN